MNEEGHPIVMMLIERGNLDRRIGMAGFNVHSGIAHGDSDKSKGMDGLATATAQRHR